MKPEILDRMIIIDSTQAPNSKIIKDSKHATNSKKIQILANVPIGMSTTQSCPAPFHLSLRLLSGIPSDLFFKHPLETLIP